MFFLMGRHQFILGICLLSCASVFAQEAIPTLPDQFTANIEVTRRERNVTYEIREFWDTPNNRLRIENHRDGNTHVNVFLFDEEAMYDVNVEERDCHVHNVTEEPRLMRFETEGTHHLASAADWFMESPDAQWVYLGSQPVRGIDCDYWQREVNETFTRNTHTYRAEYTMTWYWGEEYWRFRDSGDSRVPVRAVTEGNLFNTTAGASTEPLPFHHMYEWVSFVFGAPDPIFFHVPHHLVFCPRLTNPPLPALPESFSATIEANILDKNYTLDLREHYDFTNNRVRTERHADDGSFRLSIYNYETERHYSVTGLNGSGVDCVVTNATVDHGRDVSLEGNGIHLRRTQDLFRATADLGWMYGGIADARGIDCDHWHSGTIDRNSTRTPGTGFSYTLDWFFAVESWGVRGVPSSHRFPVRLELKGTEWTLTNGQRVNGASFHHFYDYVDFVPNTPPSWLFEPPHGWAFCPELVQKPFSNQIPESYTIHIQYNDKTENMTTEITEYRDTPNNQVRIDTFDANGNHNVELYHVAMSKHYNITRMSGGGEVCIVTDLAAEEDMNGQWIAWNQSTHRLRQDQWGAAAENAVYGGTRFDDGILCDYWQGHGEVHNDGFHATFKAEWHFAVPTWAKHGFESDGVYGFLVSFRTWGTYGPDHGSIEDTPFDNKAQYSNLRAGQPSSHHFRVPHACDEGAGGSAKELPSFPEEFRTTIEANIGDQDYTVEIREFYDQVNNRVRLENHRQNHTQIDIWDYGTERHYKMHLENGEPRCAVTNATTDHGRGPGFRAPDGSLRRSAELYAATKNYNWTYLGVASVRGIECDHWRSAVQNFENPGSDPPRGDEFTLDWYFSEKTWTFRNIPSAVQIPVRLSLRGSRWTEPVGGSRTYQNSFEHSYEFVDFEPGTPHHWYFDHPEWAFCPDLVQKQPPVPPDDWQAQMEWVTPSLKQTWEGVEWHDWTLNKVRLDSYGYDQNGNGESIVEIYDVGNLRHYKVTSPSSNPTAKTCAVTTMPSTPPPPQGGPNGVGGAFMPYDSSAHHLLRFSTQTDRDMVYGGVVHVRNMECDRFRNYFNGSTENNGGSRIEGYADVYYTVPGWKNYGRDQDQGSTIVRQSVHATIIPINPALNSFQFSQDIEFTGVRRGATDPAVFNIPSECPGAVDECPSGQVKCGTSCTDTSSDEQHCGACGTVCEDDELCQSSQCVDKNTVVNCNDAADASTSGVSNSEAAGIGVAMLLVGLFMGTCLTRCCCKGSDGHFKLDESDMRSTELADRA